MGHVRWNCAKPRALSAAPQKSELSSEEKAFFDAFREHAMELESKERSPSEERFFKAMGYVKNLGEVEDGNGDS